MKKVLIIAGILVISLIFFIPLSITGFATYSPDTSSCWYNSSHSAYPDWNITSDSDCTVSDSELNFTGSILVYGNLTLNNMTIVMNQSADGQRNITVYNGGKLNITGGSNITSNNTAYEFKFDVRSGSIFEMRDSYLSEAGYSSSYTGLIIRTNNSIIRNNTIFNSSYNGIALIGASNSTIANNTIYNNSQDGISLTSSSNENTLANNTFFNNSQNGIYIHSSLNNDILNNIIYQNNVNGMSLAAGAANSTISNNNVYNNGGNGIFSSTSNYQIITNNVVYNNSADGIDIYNSISSSIYHTIANNIVYNNSAFGFRIESVDSSIIANNTAYSNILDGIYAVASEDNDFTNNTIYSNQEEGIYLQTSPNCTVDGSTIYNNGLGGSYDGVVIITNSHSTNVSNSTVYNNSRYGIYVANSNLDTLANNIVYSNIHGIFLDTSNNLTLTNNTVYNNSQDGINFTSSWYGTISNNTVYSNSQDGIYITVSADFTVFNNTIYNNSRHAINSDGSVWLDLTNNTIYSNNMYGIYFDAVDINNIINNTVYDNSRGTHLLDSSDNIISNNFYYNSTYGIYITGTQSGNSVTNNTICYNTQGVYNSSAVTIDNNTFCADVISPANSASLASVTSFVFNVSNLFFPSSCQLYFDGTYAGSNLSVYDYNSSTIPYTTFIPVGSHNWYVYCNDSLSTNWANSSLFTFTKQTVCGDSQCETGETCSSCSADCGVCPPGIPGGGFPPTVEEKLTDDPTETPLETIDIPEPGTVIDIPSGGVSISLAPNIMLNLYGDAATIHNISKVEAGRYKIILCDQAELASYEINVTVDLAYFCMNYSEYTNVRNISIYKFDVGWEELPVGDITIDTEKHMICGKIESTPYMIAGFSRPATAKAALDMIDLAGQLITSSDLEGLNTEEARKLLDEAIKFYYNCNYDDAEEMANRAMEAISSLRQSDLFWLLIIIFIIITTIWYFYARLKRKTRLKKLKKIK